ncbi:VOC family protein [Metabacillus sp. RGM 3146]|uniref:VOC family protein n=1 Tax=Metabacillus sp. RGM 3146 TaxID=3401092 RepID=UPI003B9D1C89
MNINYVKLDHIQICIPIGKETEAKTFYLDLLGFKEIEKPDSLKANGGFWTRAGGTEIHFGVEKMDHEKSKRHPAFEVTGVNKLKEQFLSAGIKVQEEKPIPGVNRFSFFDPFNNRIEFLEKEKM